MPDLTRARSSVRTAVVWAALRPALDDLLAVTGRTELDVLDVGGGTGGFAVPLAQAGHRVTVLDPSPDALAALARRVAEAGVAEQVRAVQGDADNIAAVGSGEGGAQFDVVLCHGVLEHTDDPGACVAAAVAALRPGGVASLLVANRNAAVFARAVSGHLAAARHTLEDPSGRWGAQDPLPRRFDPDEVLEFVRAAGARVLATHGVRVFSDLVPSSVIEGEALAREELVALESAVAEHPAFRAIATQLHVLAARP